jgi:hypothetical protein
VALNLLVQNAVTMMSMVANFLVIVSVVLSGLDAVGLVFVERATAVPFLPALQSVDAFADGMSSEHSKGPALGLLPAPTDFLVQ